MKCLKWTFLQSTIEYAENACSFANLLRHVFTSVKNFAWQTVLYVDRQGASFPIGCMLPQIARLSSVAKGGRRQADSGTTYPERIPSRQDKCYRRRKYKKVFGKSIALNYEQ